MTTVICLLRGVNLGPHKRMKMEALRSLCESLDLHTPQTYVQSGNVVFRSRSRNLPSLAKRLEDSILDCFGFQSDVILRSAAELRGVVARSPFRERKDPDPAKLLVMFLPVEPSREAREKLLSMDFAPDELRIDRREIYMYLPNGMGRSNLASGITDRVLKVRGTGRNWKTVAALLAMAEEMERR